MQIGLHEDINSSEPDSNSNIPFIDIRDSVSHINLLLYKALKAPSKIPTEASMAYIFN